MKEPPQVVVVTGGTAGVGRATVRAFAMQNAKIGIIARNCERLAKTKEEVEQIGGQAIALPIDVSNPDQIERAAAEVEKVFGPIDIWVNNAMLSVFSPFKEITPEEFKRVTDVTYLGYVFGTMAALRRMLPRDHGAIVQVGSALAYRSIPLQAAYCGAKHAIMGFTDSIRSELIHDKSNVHITVVQLPAINTPQFEWVRSNLGHKPQPVPPIFQPEVAADAIVWAAHHKRREVHVGSSTIEGIWGQKIAPRLLDKYLAWTTYQERQTDEPEDPNRRDNLYEAVPGDYEAHGRFDTRAHNRSMALWLSKNRNKIIWLLTAVGVSGLIAAFAAGKENDALLRNRTERANRSRVGA